MGDHAWCKDVARDERVRAAEDGRDRPLPTLAGCIETAFSAGVRDSFRKVEEAWAMIPKSVSGSSPVDHENKGDGMRTERITLEVTHDDNDGHIQFRNWDQMLFGEQNGVRFPGESVRVVEVPVGSVDDRAYADSMGCDEERDFANRILDERDAAIRERDAAVTESERRLRLCETMKRDGDSARFHAAVAQARVAELEAASGGGEPDAWGVVRDGNVESVTHRRFRRDAGEVAEQFGGTVVPLYRSPPQPRGWLTGEERELIAGITDEDAYTEDAQNIAKGLLARSTPPKVVLPCSWKTIQGELVCLHREVIAALAAAGVEVKEVERE